MITLTLSLITVTHIWANGSNVLVKVCTYYAPYEVSRKYYYSPVKKIIPFKDNCLSEITVTK